MIRVPADLSPAAIEDVLDEIRNGVGQGLQLPISIARGAPFGLSSLIVQAVARWSSLQESGGDLYVPAEFAQLAESRRRFASTPYGMASLFLADRVFAGDGSSVRGLGLKEIVPFFQAMSAGEFRDTVRGPNVFLGCFQGSARSDYPATLYAIPKRGYKDPEKQAEVVTIHPKERFARLLRAIGRGTHTDLETKFSDEHLLVLGEVVFQLFKNADIHTVKDQFGNLYRRSMRGLMVQTVSINSLSSLNDYVAGDHNLRLYLTRAHTDKRIAGRASRNYVEFTVFDTGPGLALRWLSEYANGSVRSYAELPFEQELDAVKECFELHSSTHKSGAHGDGLPVVLRCLRELNAFMALRTGRVSLFQDFSAGGGSSALFQPKHRFPQRRQLSPTAGTSYTICVPVPE